MFNVSLTIVISYLFAAAAAVYYVILWASQGAFAS